MRKVILGEKMEERITIRLTKENKKRIKRIAEKNKRSINYMINHFIEAEHIKLCNELSEKTGKSVPVFGDIWY